MENRVWQLRRGEEIIGTLTLEAIDMFWFECRFEPSSGWPAFKPFIDASHAAWQRKDVAAARAADDEIYALGLEMVPDDGGEIIRNFMVRISGDHARFRW
ncbi:hypothetical protein [Streptomyces sp. KR80]|uniref:hypothetical protein n=1 Tax=Streptomyces sp. KR80 TaxID=3457426 RepID=UPI003FD21373